MSERRLYFDLHRTNRRTAATHGNGKAKEQPVLAKKNKGNARAHTQTNVCVAKICIRAGRNQLREPSETLRRQLKARASCSLKNIP